MGEAEVEMTNEKPWRIADLLADLTFVPFGNGMERATINGVQIVRQNGRYWIMTTTVRSGATLARRTSIPLWIICSESESGDGRPLDGGPDGGTYTEGWVVTRYLWNLFHRPHSWFDLFTQMEGPPQNLAEWQAAIADMER
jgi:hypothetical protein